MRREVHAASHFKQGAADALVFGVALETLVEIVELIHARGPQLRLQRDLLLDQGIGDHHFVTIEEIGEGAVSFGRMADDRGGLAIARSVAECFQRGVNPVVLRRVHGMRLPSERLEYRPELRHGKNHAAENIELAVVVVHQHAEIVQVLLARIHHGFPDRTFLQFTVAETA